MLSWVPVAIVKLLLALLGLLTVPLGLVLCEGDYKNWPDIFWLWGNDEDGLGPEWWEMRAKRKNWPLFFARFWWLAIRNPVNNFRFLFKDRPFNECGISTNWMTEAPMEGKQLLEAGQPMAYLWIWSGLFAGYRRVWLHGVDKYSEIWFGWKLASGVPGLGFTTQVRLKREIGT